MQYNSDELNEILNIYKAESDEIIQELNSNFLELEKKPEDKTPLKKLLQLCHSLKGASRMLGFNSIQDIAHKLEDVLSFWKKNDTAIEAEYFETIYEICDFLYELVESCVSAKEDCKSTKIIDYINKLDNFIVSNKMVKVDNPDKVSDDYILKENIDINAIVLELMFIIEKDNEDEDVEEIRSVIAQNLKELSDIFHKTNYSDINNKIELLLSKVENNSEFDLDFFKQEIPKLRKNIYNLFKKLNIKSNINKNLKQPINQQNQESQENINVEIDTFDEVLKNIQKLKYEKDFLIKVTDLIKDSANKADNKDVLEVLNKTINILELFIKKDVIIDNDCYMVILHSVYLAKKVFLKEKIENTGNILFLLQRLNLLEDMFNISNETQKNELQISESSNIVNPEEFIKLQKNIQSFDLQEIKTLRIDSTKLDSLISQTGELIVNGIKTSKHITELSKLNAKIMKWNSTSKKIMNYLKYVEKKGFLNNEINEESNFFKRVQAFFNSNAEIINEINMDFGNLYNMISEDNNKLHQTSMEIETIAKGIRVLPMATIFHSFPRMVRDIANENKKKINFIISGSDTTVDKKILEEIKMPLIHILRNSIYHGIETPEERIKNNKDEIGTIKLTAKQRENSIILTIEDDGYGINYQKVKETALTKGLLTQEEINVMSNEQVMKILFLPGFSTENNVNEISGRGIGLDVVKSKITNLNGDIYIDSILNKGCRVTIRLPLSMSTIKTFIILVNNQKYAIPINSIKYVRQVKKEEIFKKDGINCIFYENHTIPVCSLSEVFEEKNKIEDEPIITVIIIENQGKQVAFMVDKLLGDQEVFHKKLVLPILKIKNISGFTTLPSGEICLIINPYELMRQVIANNY